ncbi:hypothetical protein [Streptomyces sp. NPDC059063]|uniref:hypothetical protein n=1 Tax=unclassified Streptomyces TaxID=2593676 RepID=UPI00367A1AF8
MAEDPSFDQAPGGQPRGQEPDGVEALSAPRRLSVDDHTFTVGRSTCRLQLFTAAGARPVAVVTQIAGEGMTLMNGAESFAAAVWEQHCPQEPLPPVWAERQLWPEDWSQPARWKRVVFAEAAPYRLRRPRWLSMTTEQLENLIGTAVATDRGTGYVPRPKEPEPQPYFEAFAVVRLARPHPFREPECMPKGVGWRRRWMRQVLPRHAARECCWYHGGNWHTVCAMALSVLKQARAQHIAAPDMQQFAAAYAAGAGADPWQTQALATLFCMGDAIQPSDEVGYINGQHRAQALIEQGVHRTVVLRWTDPGP